MSCHNIYILNIQISKFSLNFFKAYKMKVMSVVGKGYKSLVRAIEPGDVAGISSPRLSCQNAK